MLFKSELITQGSGSLGGITLSRNKGGMYFRARAVPTNPGSSQQTEVRAAVGLLSKRWGLTLTSAQRYAWKTYAENVLMIGPLGDARNIGGLAHYIRSNVSRIQAALSVVDAAPIIYNLGTFTAPVLNISAATDTFSVAFTNTDSWATAAGGGMIVYGSTAKSVTINYHKGPYRHLGTILGDTVPPTSPASLAANGLFSTGQKGFAMIRVSQVDGRLSEPFRTDAIAI